MMDSSKGNNMSKCSIVPLFDRVLITKAVAKNVSEGGLYIPESAKEQPLEGIVVSIGADVEHVKGGDVVMYAKYGATEISVNGEDMLILKEKDILAIIK